MLVLLHLSSPQDGRPIRAPSGPCFAASRRAASSSVPAGEPRLAVGGVALQRVELGAIGGGVSSAGGPSPGQPASRAQARLRLVRLGVQARSPVALRASASGGELADRPQLRRRALPPTRSSPARRFSLSCFLRSSAAPRRARVSARAAQAFRGVGDSPDSRAVSARSPRRSLARPPAREQHHRRGHRERTQDPAEKRRAHGATCTTNRGA